MGCCSFTGRPEPLAKPSQLMGTALAGIARMLVHRFVRCIGRARAERAGQGLPMALHALKACVLGDDQVGPEVCISCAQMRFITEKNHYRDESSSVCAASRYESSSCLAASYVQDVFTEYARTTFPVVQIEMYDRGATDARLTPGAMRDLGITPSGVMLASNVGYVVETRPLLHDRYIYSMTEVDGRKCACILVQHLFHARNKVMRREFITRW